MTLLHAVVLGIVQGVGEFLPISSSAHLVLVPWIFGWPESGLTFDVSLHMGTLVAVTLYFWRDLLGLAKAGLTEGTRTPMGRIAWGVVLGTIPGALFGFLLSDRAEAVRNPISIAILLATMGFMLYLADDRGAKTKSIEDVTVMDVFWMGVGQAMAIIPGVSRAGATITAGLIRKLDRAAAAKVSFLLGWPIILGAGLLALRHMHASDFTPAFWTGVVVSAATGYAVISFLMDYLRRGTYIVFAWYRAAVAVITLFLVFLRG